MTERSPTARDLPDDLPLPLVSGAEWWYWLGGRPALDLVNTLRERWNRRVETLCTVTDAGEWLHQAGLTATSRPVTPSGLHRLRDLREAIDTLVRCTVDHLPADPPAVTVVNDAMAAGGATPRLVAMEDGLVLHDGVGAAGEVDVAIARIALDAARMVGTPERARLRVCASPTCSARFYDRSPAGRRRWCSMQGCGNREKVRRHRAAHHTTTEGE